MDGDFMVGRRIKEWEIARPCLHLDLRRFISLLPVAKIFLVIINSPLYLFAYFFFNLAVAHRVPNQQLVPLFDPYTNTDKVTSVRSKRTFTTETGTKLNYQCFKLVLFILLLGFVSYTSKKKTAGFIYIALKK